MHTSCMDIIELFTYMKGEKWRKKKWTAGEMAIGKYSHPYGAAGVEFPVIILGILAHL